MYSYENDPEHSGVCLSNTLSEDHYGLFSGPFCSGTHNRCIITQLQRAQPLSCSLCLLLSLYLSVVEAPLISSEVIKHHKIKSAASYLAQSLFGWEAITACGEEIGCLLTQKDTCLASRMQCFLWRLATTKQNNGSHISLCVYSRYFNRQQGAEKSPYVPQL